MGRHKKTTAFTSNDDEISTTNTTNDIFHTMNKYQTLHTTTATETATANATTTTITVNTDNQQQQEPLEQLEQLEPLEQLEAQDEELEPEAEPEADDTIPKRRGRKPRTTNNSLISDLTNSVVGATDAENQPQPQPATDDDNQPRKKRGRKPKEKFCYDSDPLKFGKYTEDEESIIVKLPISCLEDYSSITENAFSYNPTIIEPKPFNSFEQSNFIINNEMITSTNIEDLKDTDVINAQYDYKTLLENESNAILEGKHQPAQKDPISEPKDVRQIDIILQNKSQKEQRLELLVQFSNNLFTFNEGIRTDIACFWCCHGFDCHPWGIPIKMEGGKFHLFGVCCSANCAAAYLFNVFNKDNLWDMYSMLNLLYYKVYGIHRQIIHAPDKICLKKFGGNLDINEYRNRTSQEDKSYIIKFPPCTSVIPVMEEVNMKKIQANNNKSYIPVDKSRINQASNELRLKRNKPIHNAQNTLDKCMNISST
jgi:hypothetical protein